jgi:Golgi phosphoprotein 3
MKESDARLFLHEEILLLVLRDETGTFFSKMYLPALGAALIAELLLAKRVEIEGGKKGTIRLLDSRPMGEPTLDEAMEKLRTAKRSAPLKTWVQRFSHIPKLQHKVAAGLCRKRILKEDEDQVLLLFRRKIYPQVDSRPERRVIDRLRRAIFSESREIEPRTVILLSLAKSADLLSIPFEKRALKERKERIKKIVEGDLLGKAAKEVVEAVQAAILVTMMIPVIASTAAHGGH